MAPLIIQSYSSHHFNSLISKIRINHKTNLVKFHLKRSCCTRMYLPWKINSSCPHSWFNISQLPNVCMIDLLGQLIQMRRCHVSIAIETSFNIHFFGCFIFTSGYVDFKVWKNEWLTLRSSPKINTLKGYYKALKCFHQKRV